MVGPGHSPQLESAVDRPGTITFIVPKGEGALFRLSVGALQGAADEDTGEWLLTVRDGIIQRCSRSGGKHGWQLYSISRWSAEDGAQLKRHLEAEFEKRKNRQIYWDDVPLFCYPEAYRLGIHPIRKEDVLEIDCLQELAAADPSYRRFLSQKEADYEKKKS